MQFDKKTILAFLIIGLILIVLQTDFYQKRFLPQPKPVPMEQQSERMEFPTESPKETQEKRTPVVSSQIEKQEDREETPQDPDSKYSTLLARAGDGDDVTVETNLYTAVFSTRGASIKSFVLKKYLREDGS